MRVMAMSFATMLVGFPYALTFVVLWLALKMHFRYFF